MRVNQKMLKVLAMLQKGGPRYGQQLVEQAPDDFFGATKIVVKGAKGNSQANIYSLLKRLEDNGLILHIKNFNPDTGDDPRTTRKWYRITAKGRETLEEAKATLEG